jgi:uncharacterized protein (DUF58 family)
MPDLPQLNVNIRGVVIPTWLAVCLLLTAVLSAVSSLLNWRQDVIVEREIRIQQLHSLDIQNVLIRQGIATRSDFAPTQESTPQR